MGTAAYQKHLFTRRWRSVQAARRPKEVNDLHIPIVSICRYALKPGIMMRHYPAGEWRDPRSAAKLKAMGVLAGCADLEFIWRDAEGFLRILFIEFKLPGRKQSEVQLAFMERARHLGPYCVASTIEEALAALRHNGLLDPAIKISMP